LEPKLSRSRFKNKRVAVFLVNRDKNDFIQISCAQYEMSVFDRERTFMMKHLLCPSNNKNNLKFAKSHIYRVPGASKVKSDFSTYFTIESKIG
jgi:hypothetical protein